MRNFLAMLLLIFSLLIGSFRSVPYTALPDASEQIPSEEKEVIEEVTEEELSQPYKDQTEGWEMKFPCPIGVKNQTTNTTLQSVAVGSGYSGEAMRVIESVLPGEEQYAFFEGDLGFPTIYFLWEREGIKQWAVLGDSFRYNEEENALLEMVLFEEEDTLLADLTVTQEEFSNHWRYRYDSRYQQWTDVSWGKLFWTTMALGEVNRLHPELGLTEEDGLASEIPYLVLFSYEPIYQLQQMRCEANYETKTLTEVEEISYREEFLPGEVYLRWIDHVRGDDWFMRYYDAEGKEYVVSFSQSQVGGWVPAVGAIDYIDSDWTIIPLEEN